MKTLTLKTVFVGKNKDRTDWNILLNLNYGKDYIRIFNDQVETNIPILDVLKLEDDLLNILNFTKKICVVFEELYVSGFATKDDLNEFLDDLKEIPGAIKIDKPFSFFTDDKILSIMRNALNNF